MGAKIKDGEGKDTDNRLTVASVNDGLDYIIDEEAADKYGLIFATHTWDDVTEATNLLTKANAHLSDLVNQPETIELTAADLATVDASFSSFHLGTYVKVESNPHGIDQNFLVTKLSLKLLEPGANKLTLGGVFEGISGALAGVSGAQGEIILQIENAYKTASTAIYNVEQNLLASLQVTEENIKSTVAENYYLKEDTDALVSSVSTEIEQTKNSVEIEFTSFRANIDSIVANTDAEFEEIRKFIRFVDGKILLGEVGNELELQIANDRISFLQDGAEVAYFNNRKLYVTDTQILHSLQLGKFAFMPRENGNISFKRRWIDMASSGTIQQAIRTGYRLQIAWSVGSQSVANNTSSVTAKVQLVSTGSTYTINSTVSKNGSLTINGTKYSFTFTAALSGNQTKTLFTKTVTVSHNSDGTKVCSFSATCGINVTLSGTYYGNVTASGSGTFNTIARASSISSVTSSVPVTGSNAVTVNIDRKSSSFTHTVVFSFGSYSKTTTGVGTSTSYTIPQSWLNAIPSATSGTAKVTVTTYSGSTKIGSAVSKNSRSQSRQVLSRPFQALLLLILSRRYIASSETWCRASQSLSSRLRQPGLSARPSRPIQRFSRARAIQALRRQPE